MKDFIVQNHASGDAEGVLLFVDDSTVATQNPPHQSVRRVLCI